MKIGVDSSVLIAGVHANHPRHTLASAWIIRSLAEHELVVSHHSVLEAYAVLTRLPADFRVTPSEARDLLATTVRSNMRLVPYDASSIWTLIEQLAIGSIAGGRSYDAFVSESLRAAGALAIATFNPTHFAGPNGLDVIDPAAPP